uniref:Disheveled-associated activator of morphogenesis 1 n=1 Tax=Magallana gigas TaxID=29159 RepID=A0A8W8HV04_MAGGI|nr:disheveled-associated activator of morphogenesis 1-A isoform X1 [Crassostrea gigas]XP_011446762.2 disheveled-associated activator of morphogenesis 1-A isoform X1 [Crassostrea gigas]XP_011446763.2 disheveled-associated activator of morphogenesis 1-A isoform X1 [Crassostrea gigas]XP_011446764.2 disheveled-associated activator of morphogenesis 1-A isoform X1 [Crassostrea gigas]XP_011446765.2 disheveled-associated activator of morphogenesis 1-A isoform X1 [Crassostrea gigas]XP_011446766.2 dishe
MPAPKSVCWCFGGRPPEITYGIDGETPLKAMEVEVPMPTDEKEIDEKFAEIVEELDVDKPHRDALFSLPPEKKWQIYCSKIQDRGEHWPDYYIEKLNNLSSVFVSYNNEEEELRTKMVDNLKTALRTQPMSFVTRFIEQEGLQSLLKFLENMDYKTCQSPIHTSVIGCLKALMNNSQGRAHVLAHPNCINIIAQSLATENIRTKITVLEILGAICLVPGGHRKVLESMLHYQKFAVERTRFQSLINDLDRSTGIYKEEVHLKTAIMLFINAALKYGPGKEHLEFRLHLRYEFLMLGIQPVIDKLRKQHENATLDRHLDFFEMKRNEDERELSKKFENVHVDTKSAYSMFDLLRKKLTMTSSYQHLMSILQHLLLFPFGNDSNISGMWNLADRLIQQVALQQKNGQDPDCVPFEMNVKQMIRQMSSGEDVKSLQQKLREMEKGQEDLQSKVAKKERDCEMKEQEKDELAETVTRMKAKLDQEMAAQNELKQKINELSVHIENLSSQLSSERGERQKLSHLVQTGSLPDDAKVGLSTPALIELNNVSSHVIKPSVPPPPPPMGVPPPPPPPPAPGAPPPPSIGGGSSQKFSNIPRPKHPMKSLNWSKLSETKLSGTVWSRLDPSKLYKQLDLEDFEHTFSAYQKQQNNDGEDTEGSTKSKANKELSVIDGRRAQNCTILLSKLKMTNQEVITAILTMDSKEDLPKDMLEQLLKFVPTSEETQMLMEYSKEIDSMARADRFLYEASRINHYEGRLSALCFKKKFPEKMSDIRPKVEAIKGASSELMKSRNLRQILEIILALGNFMNRGQRGNASGFRISSLANLIDTKSSTSKHVTLLHYLVDLIEKKFRSVQKVDEELSNVRVAAKVSMSELDKDIADIKAGLESIGKELKFFENTGETDSRKFVSVMTNFHNLASYNFSEIEEAKGEIKKKFDSVCEFFGEDPSQNKPEDFFGIIDSFLTAMADAKAENERIKRQKEEEEKRQALEESLKREREKLRSRRSASPATKGDIKDRSNKGEFDELISALRTGDVFGEDLMKMRRNRKRGGVSVGNGRERGGKL